ncbi:ParB/Srx family N-terminal domain-containing protein (plasmid) [Chromobacterium amazonense]|uniref:ParB/Srx family N-terminal domain-containing protein n=1 Tax=Chromobacterium amazonense TaxID=1382803 RepID=UPI00237E1633|nr:ParB/Srx family N-terminal domain-containing protein [Chromobacterium amazonense]MDE1712008.1 ParB/Srx family N-terminal domain-containing protein [Chromobacterium amazonense]
MAATFMNLTPIDLSLDQLFLDPNNPRFVKDDSVFIPDPEIHLEQHQQNARSTLIRYFDVDKLRLSMESNGYLPIDRVIVRKINDDIYLVLEGNRRICAAKTIGRYDSEGKETSIEVLSSLEKIPCLLYTGEDEKAAWIFQGIRHISGIAEWSAYNKAKLLVEQMESEELNLTETGKRFGLTAFGAGQWVRGYFAYRQAKERTDYSLEIHEESYPYFQEVFSRSSLPLRNWLEWDDSEYKFTNELNFNEFVGWLYPRTSNVDNTSLEKGEWEKRRLSKRDDLRTLSKLLTESPKYFSQFVDGVSLETAHSLSQAEIIQNQIERNTDQIDLIFEILNKAAQNLENIPLKAVKNQDIYNKLSLILSRIEEAIKNIKS